jgi:hypothetical protein
MIYFPLYKPFLPQLVRPITFYVLVAAVSVLVESVLLLPNASIKINATKGLFNLAALVVVLTPLCVLLHLVCPLSAILLRVVFILP